MDSLASSELKRAEAFAQRALSRCEELSKISELNMGILRQYLTPQHKACNETVAQWMHDIGMETWQDEVGNQWGRYVSKNPNAKRLILGSHLDTVPNAGAYDGILGVMLSIEVAAMLIDASVELPFHLDIVGFCDEEGTRFGTTLIGSKALAGQFDDGWLDIIDSNSITMADAMKQFGLDPQEVHKAALDSESLVGYWEVHIEQGPVLEDQDQALGIVTAISGAKRAMLEFVGRSGHAGTTPMHLRKDALTAAAEFIVEIEQLALSCNRGEVATVGVIEASPGAANVISGFTVMSLDVRAQTDSRLFELIDRIKATAHQIADKRDIALNWYWTHQAPAAQCDEFMQSILQMACNDIGEESPFLPSGAGHDAMAIAAICPVGMLFIRSPAGLSHHPEETVIEDDVVKALATLNLTVQKQATVLASNQFQNEATT